MDRLTNPMNAPFEYTRTSSDPARSIWSSDSCSVARRVDHQFLPQSVQRVDELLLGSPQAKQDLLERCGNALARSPCHRPSLDRLCSRVAGMRFEDPECLQ